MEVGRHGTNIDKVVVAPSRQLGRFEEDVVDFEPKSGVGSPVDEEPDVEAFRRLEIRLVGEALAGDGARHYICIVLAHFYDAGSAH